VGKKSQHVWDVFICHASEDKAEFVKPLAMALKGRGLKVWYDEFTIKLGDSLRRSIDYGLANSRFGIVVLSKAFFAKNKIWTQNELNGLFAKETPESKVILPIWHGISREEIARKSPILADRLATSSESDLEKIVNQVMEVICPQQFIELREGDLVFRTYDNADLFHIEQPLVHGTLKISIDIESLLSAVYKVSKARESVLLTKTNLQGLISYALEQIAHDQWTEGNMLGGWGKDYNTRFFQVLFSKSKPVDSLVHPHSITFSYWILEGLLSLQNLSSSRAVLEVFRIAGQEWFRGVADYFLRHFDEKTGGAGPTWLGMDASEQVAPNIRHTSSALLAFLVIPGCLRQVEKSAVYILSSLDKVVDWSNVRAISLASILRAIYTIRDSEFLSQAIGVEHNVIRKIVTNLEVELAFKVIQDVQVISSSGLTRASLWHFAYILRTVPEIQFSHLTDLRQAYKDSLRHIMLSYLQITERGKGLPYIPNTEPDIGMSGVLVNILLNDKSLSNDERIGILSSLLSFIFSCYQKQEYTKFTYSWNWAMVLLSLSSIVKCAKE
jgi:hypothetical protein